MNVQFQVLSELY